MVFPFLEKKDLAFCYFIKLKVPLLSFLFLCLLHFNMGLRKGRGALSGMWGSGSHNFGELVGLTYFSKNAPDSDNIHTHSLKLVTISLVKFRKNVKIKQFWSRKQLFWSSYPDLF